VGLPFGRKNNEPAGSPPPNAGPAPEPAKEKRKLGLPFGKKKDAAPEAPPADAPAPEAKPAEESGAKKRRFGLSRKGR